jgi:SAM-dependent methyltransferase
MTETYEYRGLRAKAWDLLRGEPSAWPDLPLYKAVIQRQRGPALDVGCGTGRCLLDYLASGLDVDGVDVSPEMLAVCRAKAGALKIDLRGRLHEQAMERLSLPRRYATIFVSSRSFQLLTDPADTRAALTRFHDHLTPGGMLVMSFSTRPWPGEAPAAHVWSDLELAAEELRESDGATVRRWTRVRVDPERQRVDEENRYQVLMGERVVETEFHGSALCWHTQSQARALYAAAGFADIMVTAGSGFDPAGPETTRFKVFGTKP